MFAVWKREADLVALVTTEGNACGVAYLFNGSPLSGFSTTAASCARGNFSYAHEIGHNQGAGHGYTNGGGYFSYSHGYHDLANGFRTIMAYPTTPPTTRVRRFSSPSGTFNGFAVGNAGQDNVRTLNETAAAIASFVGSAVEPPVNDDVADAVVLTGVSGSVNGTNVDATGEVGEVSGSCRADSQFNSVWWSWTAPVSGSWVVDTFGSFFDSTLAVYTGSVLPTVSEEVGCSDDTPTSYQSSVTVEVTGGTTYLIRVDGYGRPRVRLR